MVYQREVEGYWLEELWRFYEQPSDSKCGPADYQIKLTTTALLLIDMQRDFAEHDGLGMHGNDVRQLQQAVEGCERLLAGAEEQGCGSFILVKAMPRISPTLRAARAKFIR